MNALSYHSLLTLGIIIVIASANAPCFPSGALEPCGEHIDERSMFESIDFYPVSGATEEPWIINYPGPPRREWQSSDAEYYIPQFVLADWYSFPEDIVLLVKIFENRRAAADPEIGAFWIKYLRGQRSPNEVWIQNDEEAQARGFPSRIDGRFWLLVTRRGKLKGNTGKEDDGHAFVYLEVEDVLIWRSESGCETLSTGWRSDEHEIRRY